MRTQIAKTEYLPAEYIPPTFSTRTPHPPIPQVGGGGCYREKFFYFFLNPLSTRSNYTSIFIFFSDFRSFTECLYWNYFFWILHSLFLPRIIFYFFCFSYSIPTRILFFYFSKHCFNSSSFHSVFLISFYLFSFYTRLITILSLLRIVENYDFDIISRFRISDSEFRLVSALSILCFDSSTLYLFNSSACYKQTSMLMWVCFMLILAILRLSDVFLFVLGVVYRLWIK